MQASIRLGPISFNTKGKVNVDRRTLKKNDLLGHIVYAVTSVIATAGFTKLVKRVKAYFR